MALDKLVDSTQLDADLTTVADAIRTKGGTSAQLSFPDGMAEAIAAISGGGGSLPNNIHYATLTMTSSSTTLEIPVIGTPKGILVCSFFPFPTTGYKNLVFAAVFNNDASSRSFTVAWAVQNTQRWYELVSVEFNADNQTITFRSGLYFGGSYHIMYVSDE